MTNTALDYARSQADGADNIAPTTLQGQQAWQYAQSDNFFSPEERAAVLRQQLEPYRAQIEAKLAEVGHSATNLAKYPSITDALSSGRQTPPMNIIVSPDTQLQGRLRIVMTENGPDIRITPVERSLVIPDEIEGIKLSKGEKQQLMSEGALPRPFLMADKGEYVPTYVRIDDKTNTIELWRIRPENLPTKLMGIDLTKDQQMQLANGHAVRLSGLLDKQGEPFTATVSVSPTNQTLQFTDFNRLDVAIRPDNEHRKQVVQNNEGSKTDLTRSQEAATKLPAISNQQSETIKQLLEMEPPQVDGSRRLRP